MNRRLVYAASATALIGATMVAVSAPAGADPSAPAVAPLYREYVAMGDSYTASTGYSSLPTTEYVPVGCAQSRTDYPHQVAALLAVETFIDASCGGATIDDLTSPQNTAGGVNPPQLDRLTPTTDLVTIGIGGNDIGMVQIGIDCALAGVTLTSCKTKYTRGGADQVSVRIAATLNELETAVDAVHARSPHARVVLVNYLETVPDSGQSCYPLVPINPRDMAWFAAKFKEMNAMLATAAERTGAELVDTYTPTIGHNVCAAPTKRYVETLGVLTLNPIGSISAPLHPNRAGANAQSRIIHAWLAHG